MLHDREGFVRLPDEQLIYTSPPRTAFSLQPLGSYKGKETINIQSSAGHISVTNQRVKPPSSLTSINAGADSRSPGRLHPITEIQRVSIVFRSITQCTRHSCFGSILWPESMDGPSSTRLRWRDSAGITCSAAQSNF